MSLLDKDPYHPTVRAAMNQIDIGGYLVIRRTGRDFAKYFQVSADPQWGKRLDPVESVPQGTLIPIVMLD